MKFVTSVFLYFIFLSSHALAKNPPLEAPYTKPSGPTQKLKPIEKPIEVDKDNGDYYYKPEEDKDHGQVQYKIKPTPEHTASVFVRVGTIGPFDIKSSTADYKQVYSKKASILAYFEYEKKLGRLAGQWYIKFGSGLTTATGKGRFADASTADTRPPREKYTFIAMPNTVMLNLKFAASDKQFLIPYLEAGGGYFTFIEYRDDGKHTAFGGAPVAAGAAGLLISFNTFDSTAAGVLFEDYGINNLWFDMQFRVNKGFSDKKDFSSSMITAGFGFAF